MVSVVCTLFEGHYHYGLAALVNSLHKSGFKGDIYAGYRGELPFWAKDIEEPKGYNWNGAKVMEVESSIFLHFLPLDTDYHLTNYKPDFMLALLNGPVDDAIFYYDPDIVQIAPWSFMEEWIKSGIAVCEDVNSPLEEFHPKRTYWRNYFKTFGFNLNFKNHIYANGGFIGISSSNFKFLKDWKEIQEAMANIIGGLDKSKLNGPQLKKNIAGPYAPFGSTDQDALNATIELSDSKISFIGKEGMGFNYGSNVMFHALGSQKPWLYMPIKSILRGQRIRQVDKVFWQHTSSPICIYNNNSVKIKRFWLKLHAFINRFYVKK